jgi:hypothetical protein
MPITTYRLPLSETSEMVVELVRRKGETEEYAVVLLTLDGDQWRTVRVYDNHQGAAHLHRYNRAGEKGLPQPTGAPDAKEGFETALSEVRDHFEEMIEEWEHS